MKQNRAEAAKWYRLAAEQKIAAAQFNLGILYSEGEGVKQSQPEAAKWLRLAAEQGIAKAQSALGVVYYIGKGIEQNHAEAAKWFRLAAEQEIDRAQFNLGILYRNGEGVAQSYSEAYIWFSLASTGNDPEARKARDQVARQLDWNSMKDAQAEATRRAEKNSSQAGRRKPVISRGGGRGLVPQLAFGVALRHLRERQRIDLSRISRRAKRLFCLPRSPLIAAQKLAKRLFRHSDDAVSGDAV